MYNLKGLSTVYKGNKVLYKIDRPFELSPDKPDFLTISNDGATVAYLSQKGNKDVYKDFEAKYE